MATLIIVTHELDIFAVPEPSGSLSSNYLLLEILKHLGNMGHHSRVSYGVDPLPGDVALLHVDCTVVPDDYLAMGQNYARTINFGAGDISKRRVSRILLAKGDSWDGPVIVKNDRNSGGRMEIIHNRRAANRGLPSPHGKVARADTYQLFARIEDVDDVLWEDPSLVVERFLPERVAEGYAMRTWVFMGERERCTRLVTPNPISKAADVIHYEPIKVPEALRAERERLGFDYGKFDFVMHDGAPVLLDANKTPGTATTLQEMINKGALNLAEGLDALIKGKD